MNFDNLPIGVYGIQDINDDGCTGYVHDHSATVMKNGEIS